jgi:hypothetical protein
MDSFLITGPDDEMSVASAGDRERDGRDPIRKMLPGAGRKRHDVQNKLNSVTGGGSLMSFPKYDNRSRKLWHPYRGKPVNSATKPRKGVHAHHIEISFLGDALRSSPTRVLLRCHWLRRIKGGVNADRLRHTLPWTCTANGNNCQWRPSGVFFDITLDNA